jgi:hypothetical protein
MVDKSELLRCRGCNLPLARWHGNSIRIRKNQATLGSMEAKEVMVQISHANVGVVSIGCSNCTGITPHHFATLRATV